MLSALGEGGGQLLQFLVRNAVLVFLLGMISRLPAFRQLFYRPLEGTKTRIWFTGYWSIAGLLATKISFGSAYIPFLAGRYGGTLPGLCVGLVAGSFSVLSGASLPSVVMHIAAGGLGGLLHSRLPSGKSSPVWVAFAAGFLSVLGLDIPDQAGAWAPLKMMQGGPSGLVAVAYMSTLFGLANLLFIRLMEYLMTEGERYHAQASVRLLELANDAGTAISAGLDAASSADLAVRVRKELDLAGVCLGKNGRILAFDGACAHLALSSEEIPQTGEHAQLFETCPQGCGYRNIYVAPIGTDGAWLGALATQAKPLSPGLEKNLDALAAVLTGMLARTRELEHKAELEETRHRFLQAQIRPHFLFNTLNTIASVAQDDETRELVLHLAGFLRESFRRDKALISLQRELEVVDCYLAIEKQRFGDRLQVDIQLPEPLPDCELPSFSLQPLIENAVHHGIGSLPQGGAVRLTVTVRDQKVHLAVEDDGDGVPQKVIEGLNQSQSSGESIGLANVKARLQAHFGLMSQFEVQGSKVSFQVPLRENVHENPDR